MQAAAIGAETDSSIRSAGGCGCEQTVNTHYGKLEACLEKWGTPFFAGAKPAGGDFHAFEMMDQHEGMVRFSTLVGQGGREHRPALVCLAFTEQTVRVVCGRGDRPRDPRSPQSRPRLLLLALFAHRRCNTTEPGGGHKQQYTLAYSSDSNRQVPFSCHGANAAGLVGAGRLGTDTCGTCGYAKHIHKGAPKELQRSSTRGR